MLDKQRPRHRLGWAFGGVRRAACPVVVDREHRYLHAGPRAGASGQTRVAVNPGRALGQSKAQLEANEGRKARDVREFELDSGDGRDVSQVDAPCGRNQHERGWRVQRRDRSHDRAIARKFERNERNRKPQAKVRGHGEDQRARCRAGTLEGKTLLETSASACAPRHGEHRRLAPIDTVRQIKRKPRMPQQRERRIKRDRSALDGERAAPDHARRKIEGERRTAAARFRCIRRRREAGINREQPLALRQQHPRPLPTRGGCVHDVQQVDGIAGGVDVARERVLERRCKRVGQKLAELRHTRERSGGLEQQQLRRRLRTGPGCTPMCREEVSLALAVCLQLDARVGNRKRHRQGDPRERDSAGEDPPSSRAHEGRKSESERGRGKTQRRVHGAPEAVVHKFNGQKARGQREQDGEDGEDGERSDRYPVARLRERAHQKRETRKHKPNRGRAKTREQRSKRPRSQHPCVHEVRHQRVGVVRRERASKQFQRATGCGQHVGTAGLEAAVTGIQRPQVEAAHNQDNQHDAGDPQGIGAARAPPAARLADDQQHDQQRGTQGQKGLFCEQADKQRGGTRGAADGGAGQASEAGGDKAVRRDDGAEQRKQIAPGCRPGESLRGARPHSKEQTRKERRRSAAVGAQQHPRDQHRGRGVCEEPNRAVRELSGRTGQDVEQSPHKPDRKAHGKNVAVQLRTACS